MTVGSLPGELGRSGDTGRGGCVPSVEGCCLGSSSGPWCASQVPGEQFPSLVSLWSFWLRPADIGFTPPSSPPTRPRNDRNVFSRLTSTQSQGSALDK